MRTNLREVTVASGLLVVLSVSTAGAQGAKPLKKCPPDAVVAGTVCMDKYEASVWRVPEPDDEQQGAGEEDPAREGDGGRPGGGGRDAARVRRGDDYAPCADNGQNCTERHLRGEPAGGDARRRSSRGSRRRKRARTRGKRLPSSAEWQAAANGTPDPGPDNGTTDCNTRTRAP